MIWTNAWAWLGLAALAVPIVIHLLTRDTSTPIPFPTLRFLTAGTVVEARRRRMTDLPLLIVRCLILALVAAALAQPFTARGGGDQTQRLVIIDSSASVDPVAAREAVDRHREGAATVDVIERTDLNGAIREAAGWARTQSGSASVIVISDFQLGALLPGALRQLPQSAGVTLQRVARRDTGATPAGVARMTMGGGRTEATWGAAAGPDDIRVESAFPQTVNDAIVAAARATAASYAGAIRPVTFVLPDAPRRDAIAEQAVPAGEPWMFDVMHAMSPGHARTVMTLSGRVLVFLATTEPAATVNAMREAIPQLVVAPPVAELEPAVTDDAGLRALERQASPAGGDSTPAVWIGRWFWIAALLLLGIEALMRRERYAANVEVPRAA